jgi:hypothetical protein
LWCEQFAAVRVSVGRLDEEVDRGLHTLLAGALHIPQTPLEANDQQERLTNVFHYYSERWPMGERPTNEALAGA